MPKGLGHALEQLQQRFQWTQSAREINPMSGHYYFQFKAPTRGYANMDFQPLPLHFLDTLDDHPEFLEGHTFLDLGAGPGNMVYLMAHLGNYTEAIGIEGNKKLLEIGERLLIGFSNMKLINGNLHSQRTMSRIARCDRIYSFNPVGCSEWHNRVWAAMKPGAMWWSPYRTPNFAITTGQNSCLAIKGESNAVIHRDAELVPA